MITFRANDGSSPAQFKIPGPPVPGEWQATPSCPIVNGIASGIAFQWQNITPFGIRSAKGVSLGPPPALTSEAYTKAYNEVKTVGAIDSTDGPRIGLDLALFFAATSPTQAFNQAARQLAEEKGGSLSENARALALMKELSGDRRQWHHFSTNITTVFGVPKRQSTQAIRTATQNQGRSRLGSIHHHSMFSELSLTSRRCK